MTDIVLTAVRQGLSTIERGISRVVLLLWLSALERQLGSCGQAKGFAE